MKQIYLVYGLAICLLLIVANRSGWTVGYALSTGNWNPKGRSVYHK
jgi:hypothetical protein